MWGLKRERGEEWTHSFERDREGSWGKIGLGRGGVFVGTMFGVKSMCVGMKKVLTMNWTRNLSLG
jgi:hypothetical protein